MRQIGESTRVEFSINLWSRDMDLSETGQITCGYASTVTFNLILSMFA